MSAYSTLLGALVRATPGETWCVDNWRDEADLAELTSAEKGAAHERAVDDGYLLPLGGRVGDVFLPYSTPTKHPAGKSRRVVLYARTFRPLPGQPTPERHHDHEQVTGQLALVEVTS